MPLGLRGSGLHQHRPGVLDASVLRFETRFRQSLERKLAAAAAMDLLCVLGPVTTSGARTKSKASELARARAQLDFGGRR